MHQVGSAIRKGLLATGTLKVTAALSLMAKAHISQSKAGMTPGAHVRLYSMAQPMVLLQLSKSRKRSRCARTAIHGAGEQEPRWSRNGCELAARGVVLALVAA